jgi:putative OPT family oligopeptide transporter
MRPSTPPEASEDEAPYVPASTILPEITVKAILLGIALSAILAGANAYLGLKVGMTVSASIPAAVISMAVLRLFRRSNILENNIVQTAASAGESLAAGVIFTLPALVLMRYWTDFEFVPVLAVSAVGGTLGVLYTIPLRRALIIEARLRFPEGVATAEVLKAGTEGGASARHIVVAAVAGGLLKLCHSGLKVVSGIVDGAVTVGRSVFGVGSELGAALLAVGYIVGLDIAVLVFAGGVISWIFGIPIYMAVADPDAVAGIVGGETGYAAAYEIWAARIRYLGVGAMAAGGVWTLVSLARPIVDGVRSSFEAVRHSRAAGAPAIERTQRDTPIHIVLWSTLGLTIPIFVVVWHVIDQQTLAIGGGRYLLTVVVAVAFALVAGFLFSSVAGYMAGLVGSSNNPISGVTIATILAISLVLLVLLGSQIDFTADAIKATAAAATAVLVGGVVCCAAAIAGDNLQDLKAGRIVGATPWKQQVMQVVGTLAAAVALAPILHLLFNAYGLGDVFPRAGMDPQEALRAPQATLMASVSTGVFLRNLPWTMIAIGAVLAAAIIVLDKILERRGAKFRTPVLAVAVGIYLPVELSVPIFVGGLVAHLARRRLIVGGASEGAVRGAGRNGLLFASGLITGEALVGILLAIPFAIYQSTDVLTIGLGGVSWLGPLLGVGLFVAFSLWLYRVAARPE